MPKPKLARTSHVSHGCCENAVIQRSAVRRFGNAELNLVRAVITLPDYKLEVSPIVELFHLEPDGDLFVPARLLCECFRNAIGGERAHWVLRPNAFAWHSIELAP